MDSRGFCLGICQLIFVYYVWTPRGRCVVKMYSTSGFLQVSFSEAVDSQFYLLTTEFQG